MPRPPKSYGFHRQADDWFCTSALPSDVTVIVDTVNFHLHRFPLISRCGKIAHIYEELEEKNPFVIRLDGFPGGPDLFLLVAKFCYGIRVELTPQNIVSVHCAADFLEMTDEFGEDNLLAKSQSYFHKHVLQNWKDCIVALQGSEPVTSAAEKLQTKCLDSLSVMVCTDPSLFGWPMMMYGRLQSPGGSILWNGINTGAKIQSSESDWWFEDISFLNIGLFERLIKKMESRGIRPESLAGAVMYYARKYLPGLGRWPVEHGGKTLTMASFSLTPLSVVDQRGLLESIVKLLPNKKEKLYCRFLLGLLRVGSILGVERSCKDSLERAIGMQLELATLDALLIPSYSDSDTLYDADSVERIVHYFVGLESKSSFSPTLQDLEASMSPIPITKVAKLIDAYLAEVASDVNLKPDKIRSLAEALPDSSRPLHDALYRAVDIYFKAHPWLSDKEKEDLCNIIDYQKLSIDACAHASQNDRLPLRIVLQVLYFEQMQLRTALAGCLHVLDTESATAGPATTTTTGQIIQRDGWVTVVRENQVLKVDMERMRSRVRELEQEFTTIKQEMKRVVKSQSSLGPARVLADKMDCRHRASDARDDEENDAQIVEGPTTGSRLSVEGAGPSRLSRHRKSFSLFT